MSGIEDLILTDQYLICIAVTLFFTVVTLVAYFVRGREFSVIKILSGVCTVICWYVSAIAHVATSPTTSPLFAIAYLWAGLGTIFLILVIVDLALYLRGVRSW